MSNRIHQDYIGKRIGKTVVLHKSRDVSIKVLRVGEEYRPKLAWTCQCDCGTIWDVAHSQITSASPASCNKCADRRPKQKLQRSNDHVKKKHPSYNSWYSMIRRCTSPIHMHYKYYGGRGIKVCDEWLDFDQFVKDMGIRPIDTTIDRINNDGHYNKENCRWATAKQQASNKRTSTKVKS
jgi:hypothetical protein